MQILLVEDNDDLRHLFAHVLRSHDCDVREAADGPSALAALADFAPDLVVTDVMMPVMDGVELIRRLRAMPGMASVPMVAMTAGSTPEAERRTREAGAVDLVVKPIDVGILLESWDRYRAALRVCP